jgi:hypothetical protein
MMNPPDSSTVQSGVNLTQVIVAAIGAISSILISIFGSRRAVRPMVREAAKHAKEAVDARDIVLSVRPPPSVSIRSRQDTPREGR